MGFDAAGPKLGDVVTLIRGTTYKGNLLGQPGPVLLGLASIQRNGGFRSDSLKTYGGECKAKIVLRPGDMYVSLKDVTQSADLLGSVARLPDCVASGRLTQDTVKLEFIESGYPRGLLYWALRTPVYRSYCREFATGTTTLGLAREDFLSFVLPPVTPDSLLLVDLLEALESQIRRLAETNTTLEAIAQALFKSWFVDFDPVHAKAEGREPEAMDSTTAALFPNDFEASELGLIPKGWRVARLSDLVELAYGRALKASDRVAGEIPVYGSGGITGWHDAALVKNPTIIVGRKGSVGTIYWEDRPCHPIDTVFFVRPKEAPLTLCLHVLRSLGLDQMNTDAAVPGLNRENAYRLEVVVAPVAVSDAWHKIVEPIYAAISNNSRRYEALSQLRDTLLPRLISGKLRLPEVEAMLSESAQCNSTSEPIEVVQ